MRTTLVFVLRCAIVACTLSAAPQRAWAYPWMVRHDYNGCATCHADPSGAGILTRYGRAQSDLLLSTHYGRQAEEGEPSAGSGELFGAISGPDWLLVQGWLRNGYLWSYADGELVDRRFLQMRADLGAQVTLTSFRASATIGYNDADAATQAQAAWLTPASDAGNLVSREHWAGASLEDDSVLVRAGRINLPFGLRNIEHTSWVRSETRTDFNQSQQHGVAVAFTGEAIRAEVMAIAGNFQVAPDVYRERGYAAYAELALAPRCAVGVSSLVTHAKADTRTLLATTRQAHGMFARIAPSRELALLAEVDALITSTVGRDTTVGGVGFLQGDVEVLQGLHGIVTAEALDHGATGEPLELGTWLGAAWFPAPHFDLRADVIRRTAASSLSTVSVLLQLHAYL